MIVAQKRASSVVLVVAGVKVDGHMEAVQHSALFETEGVRTLVGTVEVADVAVEEVGSVGHLWNTTMLNIHHFGLGRMYGVSLVLELEGATVCHRWVSRKKRNQVHVEGIVIAVLVTRIEAAADGHMLFEVSARQL